ncbi:MAG: aspartate/glutamate racemase [Alteromonadaceae bacterium]|nr:aspartate/glutamate racemase [Alteromonadaceae bacterium]
MKQIGIVGGMSWESSAMYYSLINSYVKQRLGGLHSARILLNSVDFAEISQWQHENNWDALTGAMVQAAKQLEAGGADGVAIATNTMHKVAPEVEKALNIPLLHIADATASMCERGGINKAALTGTRFTMEQAFYTERLKGYGINVLTPEMAGRQVIHDIIYNELCKGETRASSKEIYQQIIEQMAADGAQAVILGCTEIGMLIKSGDVSIPVLDTTEIHCESIVDFMLG